ncbi:MAG: polysaccharide pyruvyl transferase family protein [Lachnospiraceae bacterium]|nr:polysaccharide pyruvyl transferase family protein [Lachnospiraceae bacterium]
MKKRKILMRAGTTVLENLYATKTIFEDAIGGNVGNLVYANSVLRALLTDDEVEIVPDHYYAEFGKYSAKDISRINEEFEAYIIPFADAFRKDFIRSMKRMTNFIKRLRIPVIIVGVGVSADYGQDIMEPMPQDDAVRELVTEVLNRSSVVGVRGESTYRYLTDKLGFPKDSVTVIGCPSMYTFGPDLKLKKEVNLTPESKIIITDTRYKAPGIYIGDDIQKFLIHVSEEYPDFTFVPQLLRELKEIYIGAPYSRDKNILYPANLDSPLFKDGRGKFFLNVPTWLDFASKMDLAVGPRIHGSIAPVLAGTPALAIVKDTRMQELVTYHHLAYVTMDEVHADTELADLIDGKDFHEFEKYQEANFDHYLDFLHANGLRTIYDEDKHIKEAPLDRKVSSMKLYGAVTPFYTASHSEQLRREGEYFSREEAKIQEYRDRINQKNRTIDDLKSRGLFGTLRQIGKAITTSNVKK